MNKKELIEKAEKFVWQNVWDERAIDVNKQIIDIDNEHIPSLNRLGKCYTETKQYLLAIEVYNKVLRIDKNNNIARNRLKDIKHIQSLELIRSEATLRSEFKKLINVADAGFQNQDDSALIAVGAQLADLVGRCISVNYDLNRTCRQVVSAHLTIGTVDEAIQWLDKIVDKVKNLSIIRKDLLEVRAVQGPLFINDIQDVYLLNRLAALHKTLFSYRKAISIYERSSEIDHNNIYTYNGMGGVYKDLKQYDTAIDHYNKAYGITENNVSLNGLGAAYRGKGQYKNAISFYKKVLDDNGLDKYANNGIGAVYFDMGMYELGTKYFMVSADPEYLINLSYEYESKSQLNTAIECLTLLLKKYPEHREASDLLGRFKRRKDY